MEGAILCIEAICETYKEKQNWKKREAKGETLCFT